MLAVRTHKMERKGGGGGGGESVMAGTGRGVRTSSLHVY